MKGDYSDRDGAAGDGAAVRFDRETHCTGDSTRR